MNELSFAGYTRVRGEELESSPSSPHNKLCLLPLLSLRRATKSQSLFEFRRSHYNEPDTKLAFLCAASE